MTLHHHIPIESEDARKDHLWFQISSLPYFRGLLRAVEARFYENIDLPKPTLDLGCGDGHFATLAFDRPLEVGLDPVKASVLEAEERGGYLKVIEAPGDSIPFGDDYFSSAVSNSVLEHISDLDPVLKDLARVLKPDSPFVFCVPNHNFLPSLSVSNFFDALGFKFVGKWYRQFFNRIARHYHCDDPVEWEARLERTGFELVDWWHYFSPKALHILEWGHYFGLPSIFARKLFGKWILLPSRWNLFITEWITKSSYNEKSIQPDGTCTFYVAKRKKDQLGT